MTIRIPIGPAAALFEDCAADFAPAPAERTVRFADTPVEFLKGDDKILVTRVDNRPTQMPGRKYH